MGYQSYMKQKSRSYLYDAKSYIDLQIKGHIFDQMNSKKDTMIVKYNDEWSLPTTRFEDPGLYRTGKKDFIMKFYFFLIKILIFFQG